MKKFLEIRLGIIQKLIIVAAVFAMTLIWPFQAIDVSHVSEAQWDGMRISGASNEAGFVRQEFSPNFEQLQSISVYVVNDRDSFDTMQAFLRVYDYTGACLSENFFNLEDYEVPGYITIPVDLTISPGTLYFYTIGGVDGDLLVAYCSDADKTAENGAFYYKEVPSGGTSIVTGYKYERPMGLKRILIFDGAIAFAAFALLVLVTLVRNKISEATYRKTEKIMKLVLYVATAAVVLVAFYQIVLIRAFTDSVLNIIVLFLGVLIAGGLLAFWIKECPSAYDLPDLTGIITAERLKRIVRALLWAAAILFCCMYLNGSTDYEKGLYLRDLLTCFGLILVSYSSRKEIFNIPNCVITVLAVIGGKYYISLHSDHIEHINTATRAAYTMWSMALVVMNFLYSLRPQNIKDGTWKRLKDISVPFAGVWLVLWILCMVFSNGKKWPTLFLIVTVLWYVKYTICKDRKQILEDICKGILLAFAGSVIFCLYRRPYQYFMLTRYGGIFHTSTVTAVYLLLPICAALIGAVKLYKSEKLKKSLCGLTWLGIAAAYMIFTASRTGFLAMLAVLAFYFLYPIKGMTQTGKGILKRIGAVLAALVLGFIMTFSAARILPAVSANPFYFGFERGSAFIEADTGLKGDFYHKYITVERTLEMLFGRLFSSDITENAKEETDDQISLGAYLVSGEDTAALAEASESLSLEEQTEVGYTNGRMDIFAKYLAELNWNGHEDMGITEEDGNYIMHAHNSYIQMAHDFGIPTGIWFLLVCGVTFIRASRRAYKYGNKNVYECLPLFVTVAFGVASLAEWVYSPTHPIGFIFLILMAPLLLKEKTGKAKKLHTGEKKYETV